MPKGQGPGRGPADPADQRWPRRLVVVVSLGLSCSSLLAPAFEACVSSVFLVAGLFYRYRKQSFWPKKKKADTQI